MFFQSPGWRKVSQRIIKNLNKLPDLADGRVVVALSGGQDSVFLLTALLELRKKYKYELFPAYIYHGLISENDLYQAMAVLCAQKLGLNCEIFRIKPCPRRVNLEDWMRNERYRLLESYRKKISANYIAVAHHEDDQAETVLAHVIRGCGIKGLAGMPFKRGKIIRPIIEVSKTDIITLSHDTKLPYYNDKLNYPLKYQRNKIRHRLLPYLKKNFNPQISSCLARLADAARDKFEV